MRLTNPLNLSSKQYSQLGRLCAIQRPEVARQLLAIYDIEPHERDQSRIKSYFLSFCSIQNINPEEYRGSLYKSSKVEMRRLFIACIVRIYQPHLYVVPAGSISVDWGFIQTLAKALDQKKSNVTKMTREIVVQEKVYPEFKAAVDEIVVQLMKKEAHNGGA